MRIPLLVSHQRQLTPATVAAVATGAAIVVVLAARQQWRRRKGTPPTEDLADATPLSPGDGPGSVRIPASTWPVLGNLWDMLVNQDRLHDWITEQSVAFEAEPWLIRVPGLQDVVVFTKPEAILDITTTQFDKFEKGPFQCEQLGTLLGRGIVTSDGERWYHQRRAAEKFFNARSLRACMTRVLEKNLDQLSEVLDRAATGAGSMSETVDMLKLFHQLTLQTFVEVALGLDLERIGSAEEHPFEHAVDTASALIARRFRLPPAIWRLERLLGVGPEAELARCMEVVHAWLAETITSGMRKAVDATDPASGPDDHDRGDQESNENRGLSVVELFARHSREDRDGVTSEDFVDFVLTFVLAARDTSAFTLSWMLYALSKHPQVERTLIEEMTAKLPPRTGAGRAASFIGIEHIRQLTYLEATIKEVVRLYPAGPYTIKEAREDVLVNGETPVRKGQLAGINAYAIARNPLVWGPDAAEFNPERWIDPTSGEVMAVPASKFTSFHAGPRSCIGKGLALLQLRVIAANLLWRYHFDVDPSNDGSYTFSIDLAMSHPLLTRVTAREGM